MQSELSKKQLKIFFNNLKNKGIKLPSPEMRVINKLIAKHFVGTLVIRSDNNVELRIPDPELLKTDGPKELSSQHLYINLTKFIKENHHFAARCVKTNKVYSIMDLMLYEYLDARFPNELSYDITYYINNYNENTLPSFVFDKPIQTAETITTKIINPGKTIPLNELPDSHPAIVYLKSRGFNDIQSLVDQFDCAYCYEENPQLKHIYKKDLTNYVVKPLAISPQGRIIFYSKEFEKTVLWQGRFLELEKDNKRYIHSTNLNEGWIATATKINDNWVVKSTVNPKMVKTKYLISPGGKSSNCVCGFDAAIRWNYGRSEKVIGICEGVLDAARIGPPFCAVLGSTLSHTQAIKIKRLFNKIIVAEDNDTAGSKLFKSADDKLESMKIIKMNYDTKYKDLGDITDPTYIANLRINYGLLI